MNNLVTIKNVRGYIEEKSGIAFLNLEALSADRLKTIAI